jgi:hypothetical protein
MVSLAWAKATDVLAAKMASAKICLFMLSPVSLGLMLNPE